MALFQPCPCPGVFTTTNGLWTILPITRATTEQNSAGEIVTSFAALGNIGGKLHPEPPGMWFMRDVQGQRQDVAYTFYVEGNANIQEGDRSVVSNKQIEALDPQHYGTYHTEITWKVLGR